MGHETATWQVCRKKGVYRSECPQHGNPQIKLDKGNWFPACPPKEGEGRGHFADWILVKSLQD